MDKKISLLSVILVLGLIVSPSIVKAELPPGAVAYWNFDHVNPLPPLPPLDHNVALDLILDGAADTDEDTDDYAKLIYINGSGHSWDPAGISNKALNFNGGGTVAFLDNKSENGFPYNVFFDKPFTTRTWEVWIKIGETHNYGRKQVIFEEGGTWRGFGFYIYDGEVYGGAWLLYNMLGFNHRWLTTKPDPDPDIHTINPNEWNHLVFVYDASHSLPHVTHEQNTLKLYLNGVEKDSVNYIKGMLNHGGGNAWGAMAEDTRFQDEAPSPGRGNYDYFFDGLLDEAVVYNRALTADEVLDRYQADSVAPVTSIDYISDVDGNSNWYISDVNVILVANDAESGVSEIHYNVNGVYSVVSADTVSISLTTEGINTIDFYAVDNAGNIEVSQNLTVNIDKTPPLLIADITGVMGNHDWHISDVIIDFSASDAVSGIGAIGYKVNDDPEVAQARVSLTTEGTTYTIIYHAVDIAGNDVSHTLDDIKIDKTAPVTSITDEIIDGTMGNNNWYVSNVNVNLAADDAESGVREIHYIVNEIESVILGNTAQISLTNDGIYNITYYAVDNAGNIEEAHSLTVQIDSTSPVADANLTSPEVSCLASICDVTLDGTGSSEVDDIILYEWYENYGTQNPVHLDSGVTTNIDLALGDHAITLLVTDSAGNTDDNTIDISVDPVKLSLLELKKTEVEWNKKKIKLSGKVALPMGISHDDTSAVGALSLILPAPLGEVVSISSDELVNFTIKGHDGKKWEYKNDSAALGSIKKWKINWKGAKFEYENGIKIESEHLGAEETTLEINRKNVTGVFTISVGGVIITVDEAGNATASPTEGVVIDIDDDGEIEVDYPFALTAEMTMDISISGAVTDSVLISDYYTAAIGKFKIEALFDPGELNGLSPSQTPATLQLEVELGEQGFPGTSEILHDDWKHIKTKEWKYKQHH